MPYKKLRNFRLPTGKICILTSPKIPFLKQYYVLHLRENIDNTSDDLKHLSQTAHRVARALARDNYNNSECYSLVYNAQETSRRPNPHIHIFLAQSIAEKRKAFFYYCVKHITRKIANILPNNLIGKTN